MKKYLLYLSSSFLLIICAVTSVIAYNQWPYIAMVSCAIAIMGTFLFYCGIHGIACQFSNEYRKNQHTSQLKQDCLIQTLSELRSTSEHQSALLLAEQKGIYASLEKMTNILGSAVDCLSRIQNELVDPTHPDIHLIPLLSDSFQTLPSRIREAESEHLEQIRKSVESQNHAVLNQLSTVIEDLETTADYLDQIQHGLIGSPIPETPLLPLLSDSLRQLPTRIYRTEEEQLNQIRRSTDSVTNQLLSLEAVLTKYMENYQNYMEQFTQLSQQDLQILNELVVNDHVH